MDSRPAATTVLYVCAGSPASGAVRAIEATIEGTVDVRPTAASGAVTTLAERPADCLVTEHPLPDGDGLALLGTVREESDVPVVLYVAEGSEALARRAIRRGVTDYVSREENDSHAVLAERVRAAVDGRTGHRAPDGPRSRQQSGKLFEALSATLPDSVYVYSERGEYLDAILGRRRDPINTREDLVGTTVEEVFDAETADSLRGAIQAVLETGEIRTVEYSLGWEAGTRWFEGALAPIPDGYRGEPAVLLSARDITERRRRERELRRKNEFLDEFASVVSHDVATPLGVIENRARLVEMTGDTSHAAEIYDAVDRIETLIDELGELAQQGKRVGDTSPVALEGVTREAWRSVESASATLAVESTGVVEADRSRLRQLLENLLRNAVDHGGVDGPVTIRVGTLPGGFYVADDGPGIQTADRGRLFEQGYTTAEGGTGMGLAIVRRIVAGHGWTVGVTESDGGGARFEITGVVFAE
jgi:signal transduction histidine kinase